MDIPFKISLILPVRIKKIIKPVLNSVVFQRKNREMKLKAKKIFSKFITRGDLVFDIGAYIGDLTEVFLDIGARVVAIEPNPYCTRILKRRYGENDNVIIIEEGVGDSEGKSTLYINELNFGTSTFLKEWIDQERFRGQPFDKRVVVSIITLDSLIKKFGVPKFCKIDVEGFEDRVISGLSVPLPFLSFEFTNKFPDKIEFCIDRLSSLWGMKFRYSQYENYELQPPRKWVNSIELQRRLEKIGEEGWGDIYAKFDGNEK